MNRQAEQHDWTFYRDHSLFAEACPRTGTLIADRLTNSWTAVYRLGDNRKGKQYPAFLIGLSDKLINLADLQRAGDREKGEPRDVYDAKVRSSLNLLDKLHPDLPSV